MPRIRTIKPEFPQSESMGRVSRDSRLLFVQLWTLCDDSGRTRAPSRMLASLLYPYDNDAPSLIEGWLGELEREGCIVRYEAHGHTYLEICNWLNHQKIDKPSASKIPAFDESSRILANPREPSSLDQGPRTKDQGGERKRAKPKTSLPVGFTISDEVKAWAKEKGHSRLEEQLEHFIGYAERSGNKYADWDAAFKSAVREDWAKLKANGSEPANIFADLNSIGL